MTLQYRVCTLPLSPDTGLRRSLRQLLAIVLPQNDPDFADLTLPVTHWWLELDGWMAIREIGFGPEGRILRFAPIGENRGVFIGEELSPGQLTDALEPERFAQIWTQARQEYPSLG